MYARALDLSISKTGQDQFLSAGQTGKLESDLTLTQLGVAHVSPVCKTVTYNEVT